MAKRMITAGRSPAFGLFKDGETDWAGGLYPTDLKPMQKLDAGITFQRPYTVRDRLHEIDAAALALASEGDGEVLQNQAVKFLDGISSSEKRFHLFELARDGSVDQGQLDNRSRAAQVMFDWLDELFE